MKDNKMTLGRQRYKGPGGEASIKRLRELGFDPMEALVEAYKEIKHECEQQEMIRDKRLERLRADGKPKQYSADFHMACIDRKAVIGEKLMRYMYARVPENDDDNETQLPSLTINLHKDNTQFTLNPNKGDIVDD